MTSFALYHCLKKEAIYPNDIGVVNTTIASGFEALKKLTTEDAKNVNCCINRLGVDNLDGTYK